MHRFQSVFAIVALTASLAAFAAGPTTKPDPSVHVVENKSFHFSVAVPKAWTVRQTSDQFTVYNVPSAGNPAGGGLFYMLSANSKKGKATLEKQVEAKKAALIAKNDKTKFIKDEARVVGGSPGWLFLYDVPVAAKEQATVNGKPLDQKDITIDQRCMNVMTVRGDTVIDLTYFCEASGFPNREKLAERVLGSFEWTEGAPAVEEKNEAK